MLTDREDELALLKDVLRAARGGRGSATVVSGPLGIGRSALLHAAADRASATGFRVLRAAGSPLETDHRFGVVRQLFDVLVGRTPAATLHRWRADVAEYTEWLFADFPAVSDCAVPPAPDGLHRVLRALWVLLGRMSADQPVLLVVDDLQWTDEESLLWLSHVAKRITTSRVAIVAAVQEGTDSAGHRLVREFGRGAEHRLRPGRLRPSGIHAMVRERFGERGDEEFVRACHEVTGGNPAYLAFHLAELAADGRRPRAAEADAVRSARPPRLGDWLTHRLISMPAVPLRLARAMALLPESAWDGPAVVVAELDPETHLDAVRALRRFGLLTYDTPARFTHPMVRTALEESMTADEQEALRLRTAGTLHGHGHRAEEAAGQLIAVTPGQGPWATRVLSSAAREALCSGRPEAAARYLRRALLEAPETGTERAVLLADLSVAERDFDPPAALRHLADALALLPTPAERAAVAVGFSPATLAAAPPRVVERVRTVAEDLGDPDDLTGPERELALRLRARRHYLALMDLSDPRSRPGGPGARTPDPDTLLDTPAERELAAVLLHGAILTGRTTAPEAARLGVRILEREPAVSGHLHTGLSLLVSTLAVAGVPAKVTPWLESVRSYDWGRMSPAARSLLCVEEAWVMRASGRLPAARARVLEGAASGWAGERFGGPSMALVAGLALETLDGALAGCLPPADGARADGAASGCPVQGLVAGAVAAGAGDLRAAVRHIVDCGRRLERAGWRNPALLPWRSAAVELHRRLGDLRQAAELAEEDHVRALAWGAPPAIGRALRLRGELTGGDAGLALLQEAAEVLDGAEDLLERSRAHFSLAQRLRGADDSAARQHERSARALAEVCGVRWAAEQRRAEPGGPPYLVSGGGLTLPEIQAARLAAEGMTNQEIAAAADVTPRAVEKRLTKVYRKLGIGGRGDLAEALELLAGPER
ncbi:hypothetical protein ADK65_18505 [Streptomyces sp. NRRL B-1140]|uniref:ATP-binding protein n=1 Tax=Streptomyces sp. NRRL B-1140 TaxID=1415549 RepID=UPI0006AFB929|nr:LuxR family transcriptional regulator [Streptomyces sp. NRRL B-1140]KOV99213.1 hypothetical protein ADK65_18505 [Streptomyces sp. NRRL B-1140]